MKVKLYFTRHGFSCQNHLQHNGRWYEQYNIYKDPPLTDFAVKSISTIAETGKMPKPDLLCSSVHLRAQETALLLYPNHSKPLYVVPYIGEEGFFGTNHPDTVAYQNKWLAKKSKKVDRRFTTYKNQWIKDSDQVDFPKFLLWLEDHLPTLLYLNDIRLPSSTKVDDLSSNNKDVTIGIVGHSNFMKKFFSTTKKNKPFNIGTIELEFDYNKKGILTPLCPNQVDDFHVDYEWKPRKKCSGIIFRGIPMPNLSEMTKGDEKRCPYNVLS